MKLHSKVVATYTIEGQEVEVQLCWKGENPLEDGDRFYDFYNKDGDCLNEGTPYHDDGDGTPTQDLVTEFLYPENFLVVAGQECPLCQCGTIEETATEYKCCGECGNIWNKPESTPQVILLPSVDGIDHALGLIPPVGWDGDMDALNQKVLDALDKVKAAQPEDWNADDLYPLLEADGFRAATLLMATIWD